MLTKTDLREYVRTYLDVDEADLPDVLVDRWTSEGWGRINRHSKTWPLFEAQAYLGVTAGTELYDPPFREVTQIIDPTSDGVLIGMDWQNAARLFHPPVPQGRPTHWSVYAGALRLWPIPNEDKQYEVRGFRTPARPTDIDATTAIDVPTVECEDLLAQWVLHRAMLREGEGDDAQLVRKEFDEMLRRIFLDEEGAPTGTPIVLNGRPARDPLAERLRFDWE